MTKKGKKQKRVAPWYCKSAGTPSSHRAYQLAVQPQTANATSRPPSSGTVGESDFVVASESEYLGETAAVVLFIAGSAVFTLGACVDLLVLLRQGSREQVNEASGLVAGAK